jgi:hypothetical protein
VTSVGRTATTRAVSRTRSARTGSGRARKRPSERCEHGLLRGTCAICLRMEETADDLHNARLEAEEAEEDTEGPADEE